MDLIILIIQVFVYIWYFKCPWVRKICVVDYVSVMEVDPTTPSEVTEFDATKLVANFPDLQTAQDAQKHCTKIISSNEALKGIVALKG